MNRTIITVVGKDTVGIIAKVCTYLAENRINILDISQTIVQGFFTMMMIVDVTKMEMDFVTLTEQITKIRSSLREFGFINPVIIDADYSQIELRVLSHVANDETMIDAFKNDIDIHTKTASDIYHIPIEDVTKKERRTAKAVNFGIIYGMRDFGLAQQTGTSVAKAKQFIEKWDGKLPETYAGEDILSIFNLK